MKYYYSHNAVAPYDMDGYPYEYGRDILELDPDIVGLSVLWAHRVGLFDENAAKVRATIDRICAYAATLPGSDPTGLWEIFLSWNGMRTGRYGDCVTRYGAIGEPRRMSFHTFDDAKRGVEKVVMFLETSGSADAVIEMLAKEEV